MSGRPFDIRELSPAELQAHVTRALWIRQSLVPVFASWIADDPSQLALRATCISARAAHRDFLRNLRREVVRIRSSYGNREAEWAERVLKQIRRLGLI